MLGGVPLPGIHAGGHGSPDAIHQSEKAILSRQSSSVAFSGCTIIPYAALKTNRCSITKRIQSSEVEINATCGPPKLKMRSIVAASVVAPTLTGEARRLCSPGPSAESTTTERSPWRCASRATARPVIEAPRITKVDNATPIALR